MFRKFSILLLSGIILTFSFCKKKNKTVEDNIPYQTVNLTINPNDALYNIASTTKLGLAQVGGWVYINGGVNGIIVYRKAQNSGADFVAIERTSTHLPDNSYALAKVQADNHTLKDTISGSKWLITDGSVINGPATTNLRLYTTFYDAGTGLLNIKN